VSLPWRDASADERAGPGESLDPAFFRREVAVVARDLLGARLVSTVDGVRTSGVIVETEAYGGSEDPASHAAVRRGRTDRNAAMFGPPGRAYLYLIYGMHWCLNVVTGTEGRPQAVLLRGLEALEGAEAMARRRGRPSPLAAGPGNLARALGVDGELYGHDLRHDPLRLAPGWRVDDQRVEITGRIGVRAAAHRPLRFLVRGSSGVSRGRPAPPAGGPEAR
jgi:DNA-3-methyladenine glycosylase